MFINLILLLIGLFITVLAAKYFVQASVLFAKRLGVPKLIIGLTIVSIGTSIPELAVNVISSIEGHSDMALGNIIGSNIANILFVFAAAVLVTTSFRITKASLNQIYIAGIVALLLPIFAFTGISNNGFSINEISGLILIFLSFCYGIYLFFMSKSWSTEANEEISSDPLKEVRSIWTVIGILILSLVALIFGGVITTNYASLIAKFFGISEIIIAGTIIAIGTSLPELITSIESLKQKQYDLMIGNIIGSNIINTLFILGLSATIQSIPIQHKAMMYITVNILATLALVSIFLLSKNREIKKWHAGILFCVYIIFVIIGQMW